MYDIIMMIVIIIGGGIGLISTVGATIMLIGTIIFKVYRKIRHGISLFD